MNRSMTRALPFPTHRLCRVGISLLSVGTMKELRRLAVHPTRFVSSRIRTSVGIRFCSCCGDASTECQDVVQPVSSRSGLFGGEASPPIFPGNPLVPMPRSSTPSRPSCPVCLWHVGAAPLRLTRWAREISFVSWLYSAASTLAVYASCRPHRRRRKTRLQVLTRLSCAGFALRTSPESVPAGFR
jgi:hypothetical protein